MQRFFHPQAEPSLVANKPVFQNLTLGFRVLDRNGHWQLSCVDDLTLQDDLDPHRPPLPGWYRIVGDEIRLLRLVEAQCDPEVSHDRVLEPLARLFHSQVTQNSAGMARVTDTEGASLAIAAPLPGERERPCELVVAPLEQDHRRIWGAYLQLARDLGFSLPLEGATHLHFDATPLCNAAVLARLVRLLEILQPCLYPLMATNPRCRRLGPWPVALRERVVQDDFSVLSWSQARAVLGEIPLSKYCDVNLLNMVQGKANKHTIEVRLLPALLEADSLMALARFWAGLFRRVLQDLPALPSSTPEPQWVLALVGMPEEDQPFWETRLAALGY